MALESTQTMYTRMRNDLLKQTNRHCWFWILQLILNELGFGWLDRRKIRSLIFLTLLEETQESKAVSRIWELVNSSASVLTRKLEERASLIYSHVAKHIIGREVLDFGCGDGQIGAMAEHDGNNVLFYDVADHRTNRFGTNFTTNWADVDRRVFNTALLLTTLHHCEDTETELERVAQVARRLIIIESTSLIPNLPWFEAAFIDWLYNRCFRPEAEIPVPGNFRTVQEWESTFDRLGFRVSEREDLGVDLPIVPEPHYLFILDRK